MYQTWRDVLFLNWSVDPDLIQAKLPEHLYVDTYDDQAWLSIVALRVNKLHPKGFPSIPILTRFSELNLRTCVYDDLGTPGMWCFSIEISNWLAVQLATKYYHLPAERSSIHYPPLKQDEAATVTAIPKVSSPRKTAFAFEPKEEHELPLPDSLPFFLMERYQLFCPAVGNQKAGSVRFHHKAYTVRNAALQAAPDWGLLERTGFEDLSTMPDEVYFSPGVDVEVFGRSNSPARKTAEEKDLGFSGYPETAFVGELPNRG